MKSIPNLLRSVSLVFFTLISISSSAQSDFQLPLSQEIGASCFHRPSTLPGNRFYFGIPLLSSINISFTNDGLSYADAHTLTDTGAYLDLDVLLGSMNRKNTIAFSTSMDLLAAGYRFENWYFDVNFTHKAGFLFRYPKELLELLQRGNAPYIGTTIDLSKTGLDISNYFEFGVGATGRISEQWTAGMRIKRLIGMDNVTTQMQTLRANTVPGDYELQLSSDMVVNTSSVFNTDGGLDSVLDQSGGITDYLFGSGNTGWATSFGVGYEVDERLRLSFDVLDLGFIRWQSNVKNYRLDAGYYSFSGIAIDDYLVSNVDSGDVFAAYVDSISSIFDLRESADAYTGFLPTQLMVNAEYAITEKSIGALSIRGTNFKNEFIPTFGLMIRQHAGKHFSFSASVSHQYGNFFALGAGIVAQFGLFNLYVLSDNLLGSFYPVQSNRTHLSFGMSISRPAWGKGKNTAPMSGDRY